MLSLHDCSKELFFFLLLFINFIVCVEQILLLSLFLCCDSSFSQGKENTSEILPPQPFSICTIMYTSGTSGDPKGVVLTHETIATFVRGIDLFMDQFEDKVIVILNLQYMFFNDIISYCSSFKHFLFWYVNAIQLFTSSSSVQFFFLKKC